MSDDQKNEQDKPSFVPEPKEKKDEKEIIRVVFKSHVALLIVKSNAGKIKKFPQTTQKR